ncbi:MAG: hypothetical protein D6791_04045, partial [Chloroflexi bacterium]
IETNTTNSGGVVIGTLPVPGGDPTVPSGSQNYVITVEKDGVTATYTRTVDCNGLLSETIQFPPPSP